MEKQVCSVERWVRDNLEAPNWEKWVDGDAWTNIGNSGDRGQGEEKSHGKKTENFLLKTLNSIEVPERQPCGHKYLAK